MSYHQYQQCTQVGTKESPWRFPRFLNFDPWKLKRIDPMRLRIDPQRKRINHVYQGIDPLSVQNSLHAVYRPRQCSEHVDAAAVS